MTEKNSKKVLIAMSGGVDSSVAAAMMVDKGFDCMGCTMRLYENDMVGKDLFDTCCSLADTEDARAVCNRIGIEYKIYHYETDFTVNVIEPFVCSYERGETPNPCIRCNKYLKFDLLYQRGMKMGFDYIATGHYARIEERDGHYYLMKARDRSKDQSYVLYDLTEEQLAHTLFPLGEYTKKTVREIAEDKELVTSRKKESQDICFVPGGDYAAMIKRYRKKDYPGGDFVDSNGMILGKHKGIINYTVGQRRGLGISSERRKYVTGIDIESNRVIIGDEEELYGREFVIRDFHWITSEAPKGRFRCSAKIRYRHAEQLGYCIIEEGGRARFTFDEPQRAISPGQSAVLYDGDTVLGGGIIDTGLL